MLQVGGPSKALEKAVWNVNLGEDPRDWESAEGSAVTVGNGGKEYR